MWRLSAAPCSEYKLASLAPMHWRLLIILPYSPIAAVTVGSWCLSAVGNCQLQQQASAGCRELSDITVKKCKRQFECMSVLTVSSITSLLTTLFWRLIFLYSYGLGIPCIYVFVFLTHSSTWMLFGSGKSKYIWVIVFVRNKNTIVLTYWQLYTQVYDTLFFKFCKIDMFIFMNYYLICKIQIVSPYDVCTVLHNRLNFVRWQ